MQLHANKNHVPLDYIFTGDTKLYVKWDFNEHFYQINFDDNNGYVTFYHDFANPITHGSSVTFRAVSNDIYSQSAPKVRVNGVLVELNYLGEYTISNIDRDYTITADELPLNKYLVTLDKQGGTGGTNSVDAPYPQITLSNTIIPNTCGYNFA